MVGGGDGGALSRMMARQRRCRWLGPSRKWGLLFFLSLSGFSSEQAQRGGVGGGGREGNSARFYKLLQVRHCFGIVRDDLVEVVGEGGGGRGLEGVGDAGWIGGGGGGGGDGRGRGGGGGGRKVLIVLRSMQN